MDSIEKEKPPTPKGSYLDIIIPPSGVRGLFPLRKSGAFFESAKIRKRFQFKKNESFFLVKPYKLTILFHSMKTKLSMCIKKYAKILKIKTLVYFKYTLLLIDSKTAFIFSV
jgi:hypothetical protein